MSSSPCANSDTEKPPFTLIVKLDQEDIQKGGTATGTLSAVRAPGFDEEITLAPVGVPPNVTPPAVKSIPKGMNEVKVEFKTAPAVALGQYPVSFTGRTRHMDKDFAVTATPANLVVAAPFALKVEPEKVDVDLGGKARFKVTATRKAGYAGPITLMLRGLPANVTGGAAKGPAVASKTAPIAAAPARQGTGIIVLDIAPWGEVFVDNKPVGVAPPLAELKLSAGRHTIEIRHGDRPAIVAQVDVDPSRPQQIRHRFE